jgi:hypothetical protein
MTTDIAARLRGKPIRGDHVSKLLEVAADEIERLTAECEAWRECAQYDPKMEGPMFKGWDRSALDRCRTQYIELRKS